MKLQVKVDFPIYIEVDLEEFKNFSDLNQLQEYIYETASEYLQNSTANPELSSFYLEDGNGIITRSKKLETLFDIMKSESLN